MTTGVPVTYSIADLTKRHGASWHTISKLIEQAGILPAFTRTAGNKTFRVYDEAADAAVGASIKEAAEKAAAEQATAAAKARHEAELAAEKLLREAGKLPAAEAQTPAQTVDADILAFLATAKDDFKTSLNAARNDIQGSVNGFEQRTLYSFGQLHERVDGMAAQMESVLQMVAQLLAARTAQALPAADADTPAATQSGKPKVCFVGLPGGHQTQIEREYKDSCELHFIAGDKAERGRLHSLAATCSVVIWAMGQCDSKGSTADIVKSVGAKLVKVTGGLGSVRAALDKFLEEVTAP